VGSTRDLGVRHFLGIRFSKLLATNKTISSVSRYYDDGNQFKVSKTIKMFSTTMLISRANVRAFKLPQGVDERL
jgi:hypothetical protein